MTLPAPAAGVAELWLVRHGESTGNVAASAAQAAGAEVIDIALRDPDVPPSERGVEQARAFGGLLAATPPDDRPHAVWSSSYLRARQTADVALTAAGWALPVHVDERLRDRELGVLDLLTTAGVQARFPLEAERRRRWGKYLHRPPGGESWADVALRLRPVMGELDERHPDQRVLLVVDDAVVLLVRAVCDGWDEEQVLEVARTSTVRNASLTRLVRTTTGGWRTTAADDVAHLTATDAAITEHAGDSRVTPG